MSGQHICSKLRSLELIGNQQHVAKDTRDGSNLKKHSTRDGPKTSY